jgi:hypothetical protein
MARPTKQGIDYFPIDVQFDDKMELVIAETEAAGLGVLVTIFQLIYQNNGYYIDNGDDLFLLVKRRVLVSVELTKKVVEVAINRNVFDKRLHDKYKILTSKGIQKRYLIGARKKKTVTVVKEYSLTDVSGAGNVVIVGRNATKEEVKEEVKEEEEVEVCRFDEFWKEYPKKDAKKTCLAKWKSRNLNLIADQLINDVKNRKLNCPKWKGGFAPNPLTYINGDRWNDDIQQDTSSGKKSIDDQMKELYPELDYIEGELADGQDRLS